MLRHGKSDWSDDALDDFDRPLAKRGRKAVKRMARWLRTEGLLPARVVSSPALRAEQTTRRLCRFAGIPESAVSWREAIYEADLRTLLEVLADCEAAGGRLLMVGHNPGFEDLVAYLTGGDIDAPDNDSEHNSAFPTAALARLELPDRWDRLERGSAVLVELVRPRDLERRT